MDGALIVDKPAGVTSHDVVAVARRSLRETRIGHTGTLDPLATGVLALVLGRATRLVQFLSAADKDYEATIRFGLVTDTYDVTGAMVEQSGTRPEREGVERALTRLQGEDLQTPPPYSAKRVEGRRAYDLARRNEPVALKPVPVRVSQAKVIGFTGGTVTVAMTCSAGFYVRSFAHALGQLVGTGACLEALRRTRSGEFTLDRAHALDALGPEHVIPMGDLLTTLRAVYVGGAARAAVSHGRELRAAEYLAEGGEGAGPGPADRASEWVRVLDADGGLIALARPGAAPGSLHPSVVLI